MFVGDSLLRTRRSKADALGGPSSPCAVILTLARASLLNPASKCVRRLTIDSVSALPGGCIRIASERRTACAAGQRPDRDQVAPLADREHSRLTASAVERDAYCSDLRYPRRTGLIDALKAAAWKRSGCSPKIGGQRSGADVIVGPKIAALPAPFRLECGTAARNPKTA